MSDLRVSILIEWQEDFTRQELWPDGDGPRVVTEAAVRGLIDSAGGPERVVREWFASRPFVSVNVLGVSDE